MSWSRNYSNISILLHSSGSPQKHDSQSDFFFFSLLFLASKMKFSRTNHNVTNTWNVNSLRLYVAVSPPVHSSLKKGGACHAAACLLIYSSHPQPFRRWASANIDALHVTQLNEKKIKHRWWWWMPRAESSIPDAARDHWGAAELHASSCLFNHPHPWLSLSKCILMLRLY